MSCAHYCLALGSDPLNRGIGVIGVPSNDDEDELPALPPNLGKTQSKKDPPNLHKTHRIYARSFGSKQGPSDLPRDHWIYGDTKSWIYP